MSPILPLVQEVATDFESAIWGGLSETFDGIKIFGCVFHWTQAVYRRMTQMGLLMPYRDEPEVREGCTRLLCLPFLPHQKIPSTFNRLKERNNIVALENLYNYIEVNWINCRNWPPEKWSVFKQVIRPNNDAEGWHYRLNRNAGTAKLNFYHLVDLIHKESQVVTLNCQLLLQGENLRTTNKRYFRMHNEVMDLWDKYQAEVYSTEDLLRFVALVYTLP